MFLLMLYILVTAVMLLTFFCLYELGRSIWYNDHFGSLVFGIIFIGNTFLLVRLTDYILYINKLIN